MPDFPPMPIPDVIDPGEYRCITIPVPDTDQHIQVFAGLLRQLTLWFNWERDTEKRGKEIAALWADIFYNDIDWSGKMRCSCGCDATTVILQRTNEDGSTEISIDNGETWLPNPDDPRLTGITYPPLPTPEGTDIKCRAASNVTDYIKNAVAGFGDAITVGGGVLNVVAAFILVILAIFAVTTGFWPLVPVFIALATAAISLGKDAYLALFGEEVWDEFTCIVYCHTEDDGTYTHAGMLEILTDIDSHFTGNVALTFTSQIKALQETGLTNAGRTGIADVSDCSDCNCGTCDVGDWIVGSGCNAYPPSFINGSSCGTETSRTDTTISMSSQLDTVLYGMYRIDAVNTSLNGCYVSLETSTPLDFTRNYDQGETDGGTHGNAFPAPCTYRIILLHSAPFTATITLAAPEDCP